ncbi:hypothetical protein K491DRAFT_620509 [Lophiostoma macrostomum CBS 122681]|uniref:Sacsin/Nov domain-containing protein n=1 Tax=Lophiostoma macrostomum CBS 122681 TaxID=1314788 RepID=A0A6A6TM49_9PLEO|nr:hypothetical protein K491DRAFT_620509 [Lophiostoma macrostomum CBS 122681]
MAGVDFARLRNQTMADGQDSEVTVNTRALIDKVLARYSSEHTTLRELIQNASDAGASTVIIKYDTDPSLTIPTPQGSDRSRLLKHIIQNHTLKRLTVTNDGQPFTSADWNRLKSIAEGNPDETKIGAFGVGFYSTFSECDEPFVVSGERTMAFYWRGNTLCTKVAAVPSETRSSHTTFALDYRQADPASPSYSPSKIPNLPALCQFLATSLTFVGLQSIELHLDEFRVAILNKKISPASDIQVPTNLRTETEGGLMRATRVTRQHSQIDAEWSNVIATAQNPPKRAADIVQAEVRNAGTSLKSFFSRFSSATPPPPRSSRPVPESVTNTTDEDVSGESTGVLFLQFCTVEVDTKVSRNFSAEIERATKKPPPKKTRIQLLTSPYHDPSSPLSSGSGNTANFSVKIFADVLPTKAGRIFIGFPTAQTTPFLAHISAPSLIPTVERENVDMNARYISTWNTELLRIAGLACRIAYTLEMSDVQGKLAKDSVSALIPQAIYTSKQFTANISHPSTVVGEKVEEAFFNCSKERSIEMLSSKGVLSSRFVRMPAETLSFLGEVPMVPQELANEAVGFMVNLHNRGFISELTMTDIRNGLESRALSEVDLEDFLKWCGAKLESHELDVAGIHNFFAITVASIETKPNDNRILPLVDIDSYVNPARINPTLPLPPETLPFSFSKSIPLKQLQMFGWVELSMVRWLRFMTATPQLQELTASDQLASQVLGLAAKIWDQLDGASKEALVNILTPHAIIPTKMGMRRPPESYFPSVKMFEDLPTVKHFPGSKDKFLEALGVRKTVDLPMVFDRMKDDQDGQQSGKPRWSHADLIQYFSSVIEEIPKKDMERLQQTPFLPGEGSSVKAGQLFRAQELYAPDQAILALGLTQIKLPFEFKFRSKEAMFLIRLGLKQYPNGLTLAEIMDRARQSKNQQLYASALEYYITNHYKYGYGATVKEIAASNYAFVPVKQAHFPHLVAPFQCFSDDKAGCLGYATIHPNFLSHADKFGVRRDPEIRDCISKLIKSPPKTKTLAEEQFGYFASRLSDLQERGLIEQVSSAKIVPMFRKYYLDPSSGGWEDRTKQQTGKSEFRVHHFDAPETVFVGREQDYKGILDYVQYSPEATAFLLKVGAKHEPSTHDLASLLCRNPSRFLNTIGQDRYLSLLRRLAEHSDALWKDKELAKLLSVSPVLLGYRDIKEETSEKLISVQEDDFDDLDDVNVKREWSLNKPIEVVIIDDMHAFTMFRDWIVAAPQEEQLEEFYARFGVRKLSDLVQKSTRVGVMVRDQHPAQKLRKDILERARLFLHEYERDASSKSIRHDAKWLSSNLSVQCVSDITVRYSLADRKVANSASKTAVIQRLGVGGIILNITPQYDPFEVSRELVKQLIRRPKQNDAIALERLLTESLRRLQAKGINVERILRQKEYEARIAKQQELEREQEEQQRLAESPQKPKTPSVVTSPTNENLPSGGQTPERPHKMPGAFNSPEPTTEPEDHANGTADKGFVSNWAKKLGFKTGSQPTTEADGPQISNDLRATKQNIANAINECRPTNRAVVESKHHQDPTELDRGGYCTGAQYENISKAFKFFHENRQYDVYLGKHETETREQLESPLRKFVPIIHGLTALVFKVDPAAVNIFLDSKSRTVAFNMSGSLFFNLAWFSGLHAEAFQTAEGMQRAFDSWFLSYCHELAHNLVQDHNARHNWYQQQIAIEYSQPYRRMLHGFLQGLNQTPMQ